MLTLAEALDARMFEPRGEVDGKRLTRSFHLTVGDVERAKATAAGIQHRAYDTDIQDKVPGSLSAFITECIIAGCTYYEDLLNNGKEFRRVMQLTPGPSKEGARAGAEKRTQARRDRAAED
jgi:hypothetical protein